MGYLPSLLTVITAVFDGRMTVIPGTSTREGSCPKERGLPHLRK